MFVTEQDVLQVNAFFFLTVRPFCLGSQRADSIRTSWPYGPLEFNRPSLATRIASRCKLPASDRNRKVVTPHQKPKFLRHADLRLWYRCADARALSHVSRSRNSVLSAQCAAV